MRAGQARVRGSLCGDQRVRRGVKQSRKGRSIWSCQYVRVSCRRRLKNFLASSWKGQVCQKEGTSSGGEPLREILLIPSNHAVQSRPLRDHFDHFDERLDDWAERSKNRNIIHRLLGPRSAVGGDAIADEDIIHHYDPATKIYAFRGEKFDVQAIATGLNDLYARIQKQLTELERQRPGRAV